MVDSKKKEKKVSENAILNAILVYVNCLPETFAWRNNTTGIYDTGKKCFRSRKGKYNIKGVADILGITANGRLLALEVKRAGGKPSVEQVRFLAHVNRLGGIAGVVRSINDVKELLKI